MYPPKYFSDTELDAALDVASATKFATIVTIDGGSILPVHVPVSLRPKDAWRDADSHRLEIFWGLDKVDWDGDPHTPEEWAPKLSLEEAVDDAPPVQDTALADPTLRRT